MKRLLFLVRSSSFCFPSLAGFREQPFSLLPFLLRLFHFAGGIQVRPSTDESLPVKKAAWFPESNAFLAYRTMLILRLRAAEAIALSSVAKGKLRRAASAT